MTQCERRKDLASRRRLAAKGLSPRASAVCSKTRAAPMPALGAGRRSAPSRVASTTGCARTRQVSTASPCSASSSASRGRNCGERNLSRSTHAGESQLKVSWPSSRVACTQCRARDEGNSERTRSSRASRRESSSSNAATASLPCRNPRMCRAFACMDRFWIDGRCESLHSKRRAPVPRLGGRGRRHVRRPFERCDERALRPRGNETK